ncbi:hypothetical protein BGW80DRAFT_361837 [Lactifluus volemus]|nr:hypothetical protein BGW80DRAFT_361837 [Lactifluus volemus]
MGRFFMSPCYRLSLELFFYFPSCVYIYGAHPCNNNISLFSFFFLCASHFQQRVRRVGRGREEVEEPEEPTHGNPRINQLGLCVLVPSFPQFMDHEFAPPPPHISHYPIPLACPFPLLANRAPFRPNVVYILTSPSKPLTFLPLPVFNPPRLALRNCCFSSGGGGWLIGAYYYYYFFNLFVFQKTKKLRRVAPPESFVHLSIYPKCPPTPRFNRTTPTPTPVRFFASCYGGVR